MYWIDCLTESTHYKNKPTAQGPECGPSLMEESVMISAQRPTGDGNRRGSSAPSRWISNNRIGLFVAFVMLSLIVGLMANATAQGDDAEFVPGSYREGELLLQLDPTESSAKLAEDFADADLRPVKQISRRMNIWLYEYRPPTAKSDETLLEQVRSHPSVLLGQFNHYVQQRVTIPNDTRFSEQWALNNTGQTGGTPDADIDAPEAWDLITGDSTVAGDQIVVAIIDGGFQMTHPDISYFVNTLEIPGNGIDDDLNGYIDDVNGWDAYADDGTIPSNTHGTHVAGIAAAIGNNALGIAGVSWGVKILAVAGSSSAEATVVNA